MSLDEIIIDVEIEEIKVVIPDPPDITINVDRVPNVIVVAAGNIGPPGKPGVGVPMPVVEGKWIKGENGAAIWSTITPADVPGVEITANKDQPNGYPGLDANSNVDVAGYITGENGVWGARAGAKGVALGAYVLNDTYDRFEVLADGSVNWGPGNAPLDTSLIRNQWGELIANADLISLIQIGAAVQKLGETWIGGQGPAGEAGIILGPAYDTNLYRQSAGNLQTDGSLYIRKSLVVDWGGIGASIYFGNAFDTTLSRIQANMLGAGGPIRTQGDFTANAGADGSFTANSVVIGHTGSAYGPSILFGIAAMRIYMNVDGSLATSNRVTINGYDQGIQNAWLAIKADQAAQNVLGGYVAGDIQYRYMIGASGKHQWGTGAAGFDTNLYRWGAGDLKTDGRLLTGGNLAVMAGAAQQLYMGDVVGLGQAGIVLGNPGDTNLYRYAANQLKTDGAFLTGAYLVANNGAYQVISGDISLFVGGAARAGILFGDANDTNLYRSAAGKLRTDGTLDANALTVNGVPVGGAVPYGTSLPASPFNGQEAILVDNVANPSYQWRFRYNAGSTSPYKWEFIGGPPAIYAWSNFNNTTGSSQWVFTNAVNLPRAGDWDVTFQATFAPQVNVLGYLTYAYLGTGATQAPGGPHVTGAAGSEQLINLMSRVTIPADAGMLQIGHLMTDQPVAFNIPFIRYTPVRVR